METKIQKALDILKQSDPHEWENWHWWTRKQRKQVQSLVENLALLIKRGNPMALLDEDAQGDLFLIYEMLECAKESWSGHPELRKTVDSWQQVRSPNLVVQHLHQVILRLKKILGDSQLKPVRKDRPQSQQRRNFLRSLFLAGTGAAATTLLAPRLQQLIWPVAGVANPPEKGQEETFENPALPGGHYIQFAARGTLGEAKIAMTKLRGLHDLQIYQAQGSHPYKVFFNHRFSSLSVAEQWIIEAEQGDARLPPDLGVVEVHAGRTEWVKTFSEGVRARLKEFRRAPSKLLAKGRMPKLIPLVEQAIHNHPYGIKENKTLFVDQNLVYAIIMQESLGGLLPESRKGAKGPMQLMPQIWLTFYDKTRFDENAIMDDEANIDAGVNFLAYLHDKWVVQRSKYETREEQEAAIIRMYNAGETAVLDRRAYKWRENNEYLRKVVAMRDQIRKGDEHL